MIAWSYGGGVQSVAIGVLIREGTLPRPDYALIADTGRERRTTWEYLHGFMQPYLDPAGLKIQIIPHDLSRVDLYDKDGLTLIPAYTAEGRLSAFCSGEWKRDTVMRWLRLQGVESCTQWIGYSIDEMRRVPDKDRKKWCHLDFPLINLFINRAMCVRLIEAAGLPVPYKSRCWMCPHQDEAEWSETLADPVDSEKALALEEEIGANDPQGASLYLHYSRVPLKMVAAGLKSNMPMPPRKECEAGFCWT